jgi:hypothetical protein
MHDSLTDTEEHDGAGKHASTQGLAPKSVRRASVSEYSSYTYRRSQGSGSASSASKAEAKGSPRASAKSPERIGTAMAAWLSLGALKKGAKRYSSPIDRLVEEEGGDAGPVAGPSQPSAHGQAASEGAAGPSGSRIGYEKVFGLMSPKARREPKLNG